MSPMDRPASTRLTRRQALRSGSLVLLLGSAQLARGATILAVRVWPAAEYTRGPLARTRNACFGCPNSLKVTRNEIHYSK